MIQSNFYQVRIIKLSHVFTFKSSVFTKVHCLGASQVGSKVSQTSLTSTQCVQPQKVRIDTLCDQSYVEEDKGIGDSSKTLLNEDIKKLEIRRKISLANKGKVPWNKGIKHSAETRELIKQRTIEALKDPKVRKKMSEISHFMSEEVKRKISIGQKQRWRKVQKRRFFAESFFMIWAGSIAEAAKKGESEQQELEWDSYESIVAEYVAKQEQRAADKAKVKADAKFRTAEVKAKKIARRALKGKVKKKVRKKRKVKPKVPVSKGVEVKASITKFLKKKCIDDQVEVNQGDLTSSHEPNIEKVDLEFVKRENLIRDVSLADQIQAAKKKREESSVLEALTTSSSQILSDKRIKQFGLCNLVH